MKQKVSMLFIALVVGILMPASTANSQSSSKADGKKPATKAADGSAGKVANPVDLSVPLKDGAVEFTAASSWTRKKTRSKIIAHEFSVKPAEGDAKGGRITVTSASGSVDENIARWKKQFVPPAGKSIDDVAVIKKTTKDGVTTHVVDISGTFMEQPRGPFGPKVEQAGYRMLAAIVNVESQGQFFLKFYGPRKTVDSQEKAFREFVNSLKTKS